MTTRTKPCPDECEAESIKGTATKRGSVLAATWERINATLLATACSEGVEDGSQVRVDSTVTETDILSPTDSQLLRDAVRVLTRLLAEARDRLGPEAVKFHDHRRAAKRRMIEIHSRRGAERRARSHRALLRLTARTAGCAEDARVPVAAVRAKWASKWRTEMDAALALMAKVVDQTRRRVLDGEAVPAAEKIVSLFEPHTDIVVKGGRGTECGHKVNLATGRSGLVLDANANRFGARIAVLPVLAASRRHPEPSERPPFTDRN